MDYVIFVYILYYILFKNVICASRILGVSIMPSYSHQIVYEPIWKELAKRGHQVVSITPNPILDASIQNLTEIDISFGYVIWKEERDKWIVQNNKFLDREILSNDYKIFELITEKTLQHPDIQNLLQETFDLVIAEWIYPAVFGFSEKFHCPLITIGSIDMLDTISNDIGNPVNPVVYSNLFLPFTNTQLTFIQRLQSIEYSFWLRRLYNFQVYPSCDKIIKKYLGNNLPPVKQIMKTISINLINRNSVFYSPHLSMPNIIEFSGIHIREPKELPKDIKLFLDNATNGVVYFSLGTNIKSHMLSPQLKSVIVATFKLLPYQVLVKFDQTNMNNLPENVKALQWCPQEDILNHKNTKVFITQGGLQSTEEAIRKRVPMIGIPFIIDQPRNVIKMVELGIAQYIDPKTITVDSFKKAIIEVAENISYKRNIEKIASLLEDEPIQSLEKVMWWIEYTLRHKGASHLRSPYLNIPWYQHYWLDVISFLLISLIIILFLVIYLSKFIGRFVHRTINQRMFKEKLK